MRKSAGGAFACGLMVAGACAALAAAPSWPSNFDSCLSAHIADTQPSGDAVGNAEFSEFDSFAFVFLSSPSFGSEAFPFDSFWLRLGWTEGCTIDGREKRGTAMILR